MLPKERSLVFSFGARLTSQAARGELGQELDGGRRFETTPSCSQRMHPGGTKMVWTRKAEGLMGPEMC